MPFSKLKALVSLHRAYNSAVGQFLAAESSNVVGEDQSLYSKADERYDSIPKARCTYIQHHVEPRYLGQLEELSIVFSRNQTSYQVTINESEISLPSLLIKTKKMKMTNMNVIFKDPVITSKRPYDYTNY
jgi:hypothetical protein